MSPAARNAVRLGLVRGLIEFRNSLTAVQDIGITVIMGLIYLMILVTNRGETVEGSSMSVATLGLPGLLGLQLATGGVLNAAYWLAADREDGTLLRAKAIPHGIAGYLVARAVWNSLDTLLGVLIVLVPGLFIIDGLASLSLGRWLAAGGFVVLGLAATLPWGAILGSLVRSPRVISTLGWLPLVLLLSISGIVAPVQQLWGWLQVVAQSLPVYWLGLGMRSAFLPEAAVAMEIGGSWRTLETLAVLGAWTVSGFLLAPTVLRRMARRESGSVLEDRRRRVLQRIG